ncbi:MAG: hypothetical protein LBF16_08045 [Pseudomonadales bacterium]|jgi:hypothetical protein|nr:hypothetical protein [Pseudomonadales bacterium]
MTLPPRHLTLRALALLSILGAAASQAVELPAGKWGMDSATLTPESADPIKGYSEECFATDFDPAAALTQSALGDRCLFTPTTDSATEFAADLTCDMDEAGLANGTLHITLNGTEASGALQLTLDAGHMLLNNQWTGKRLGACE